MVTALAARLPPPGLPGLDPSWSRLVSVPGGPEDGSEDQRTRHTWHVLDTGSPGGGTAAHVGTLLCVHGNPTWSYLWRRLLASAPAGWRVVAVDQLGMGYSDRLPTARTVAERVTDLGRLTEELGLTGPVVTVGHDWGGAISLGWALEHRAQLRGVVLTNTAVALGDDDRGPALIRLAHAAVLRDAVCVRTPTFVRATTALSNPSLPRDVRRAFASPYDSAARRTAVGDFVADIPFAADDPSAPALAAIAEGVRGLDVPALLLWGPRDPVFGERYLADLRDRLPQAALHRYEGASHLVQEDAPQYASAVWEWVSDLDRRPGATPAPTAPAGESDGRRTLWSALHARSADESPAVVTVGGETVTWSALARRVEDLAAGLAATGLVPGDRVALLVPPSPELTATAYAVWRAGGVVVVADKGLGLAGMRRALRSAAIDVVVGGRPGLIAARAMRLPGVRVAAGMTRAEARWVGAELTTDDLVTIGRNAPPPAEPDPDAECAVVFTSGSTGPAKGVVYRHRQVVAQLELIRSTYGITDADRLVAAFAPFALLGPGLGVATAVPDIDVTAPQQLTTGALADAVSAIDATIVFAAPAALRGVVGSAGDAEPAQREALGGVRLLVSAGAPVPARLLAAMGDVLPAAETHTPYGMTEALPLTDITLAEIERAGRGNGVCVGRPLRGVDVAVSALSPEGRADGALDRTPGRTGEIAVRAAHVKERYDALWATERAGSRDAGWHRTGDVGHLDAEGRLWVEGRLAHVVTTAAGPVTPVGVEQRIEDLPEVASAAVVGVGPVGTQVVVVVVTPAGVRGRSRLGAVAADRLRVAPAELTDAVRAVARVDVAAVLVIGRLPVDIRHASKIDRALVARRATATLAGSAGLPWERLVGRPS